MVGRRRRRQAEVLPAPSKTFDYREKNEDNEKIIKYLTEKREIEKKLVEEWIDRGDIYEEKKHHNVIFVGRRCRWYSKICTLPGNDNQLFVFEAAIDWDTRPCLTII